MSAPPLPPPPRPAPTARERLIVALDVPDRRAAEAMVERLGPTVGFYKVGLELAYGGGLPLVEELASRGKRVFLDLKLHDIPNTVERAAAQVARLGATFLTVHAYPQTMRAALAGRGAGGLRLLAVTVMTSYNDADLADAGFPAGVRATVAARAAYAARLGIDGLVLSAEETAAVRSELGPRLLMVTPGIRPAGADLADQKRAVTPAAAMRAGADYIVVGRPITAAADPAAAAEAIVQDIAAGLAPSALG
ncbi:orotidine-5'-phosphate decarboxylase [Chelatococcus reniformis]|uniref:Orotidine 5'-phosphate decarboxylase n=1 Tax=Chelatococcus reniformis TaxID=1494448 RepID=A0A916XRL7_9HYPH|nr:orotidine-5'-phosphate decarboxylase [Chelatococcus reniformis]GGC92909.1 orotidine 5'-phosphate decarboxylase [Chelatococcus reniformis]